MTELYLDLALVWASIAAWPFLVLAIQFSIDWITEIRNTKESDND